MEEKAKESKLVTKFRKSIVKIKPRKRKQEIQLSSINFFDLYDFEIFLLTDQDETNENETNKETNNQENSGEDTENDDSKVMEDEDDDEEPMEEEESSAKEEEDMETTDNVNKANPTTTADPDKTETEAEESNDEKSRENEVESESGKDDTNLDEEATNKIEEDLGESDDEDDEDLNFVLKTLKDNEKDPLEDVASTEPGGGGTGNGLELEIPTTEDEESTSQMSAVSPFKRPPDSVSVDGSFSNTATRDPSRERHMSVNSMDDQGSESRMSETTSESERRQSANEELAAQYAQQLAFYRYSTFYNIFHVLTSLFQSTSFTNFTCKRPVI